MGDYKLYYLDGGGHIITRDDASLPDDDAAFEKARELSRGEYVIEVYDLALLVGRVGKDGNIVKAKVAKVT